MRLSMPILFSETTYTSDASDVGLPPLHPGSEATG
jgi:hypothetical protein